MKENQKHIENGSLDFEESLFNRGIKQEVIVSPNDILTEAEKTNLSHELTPITAEGFMRNISEKDAYSALFQDVFNHVVPCDRLLVFRKRTGLAPVGFMAIGMKDFEGQKIYHLEGIIIDPSMHGSGFALNVLQNDLVQTKADIFTFHTQSRLMERLGHKVSEFDIDLTRKLALLIGTSNVLDLPRGPIDKGRYGGKSLYGDILRFDPVAIKEPGFDYLNGDAIVFAGRVRKFDVK